MNALSILEKFDAVEITNESRLSDEELAFCTAEQELYEKVLVQHRWVFHSMQAVYTGCTNFMESIKEENTIRDGSYASHRYSCLYGKLEHDKFATDEVAEVHQKFIRIIVEYFSEKYCVSIEKPQYTALLGLEKPDRIERYYHYHDLDDEEKEQIRSENECHEEAMFLFHEGIITGCINFNDIVDHIFIELDGSTFTERAEQEILEGSRMGSKSWRDGPNYEIKNKRICFDILNPVKGWRDEYEVKLESEKYLAILRALTYFDSDKEKKDTYWRWKSDFVAYNKRESEGIFALHETGSEKVVSFKYFKNGRFDVTFDSHASAQQFVTEYLYHGEAGNE